MLREELHQTASSLNINTPDENKKYLTCILEAFQIMVSRMHQVRDRWLFWWVYPVIAILIVHIGNDNPWEVLLYLPSYYTDLLLALLCTYGLGWYYRGLFIRLDQRFNWDTELRLRLVYQCLWGILLPVILIVGILLVYLRILGIRVVDSSIFYLELPLIGLFCILINVLYLMLYYRKQYTYTAGQLKIQQAQTASANAYKKQFLVHAGLKSLSIPVREVAYFIIQDKATFLTTRQGQQYLYDHNLEQVRQDISPGEFFQLNRQVLAHRSSIASYERTDTRKLKINLAPPPSEAVFVSKPKAPRFLDWLGQS